MKYFKEEEFKMDGEVVFEKMNPTLLVYLDALRQYVGRGFVITSSYRSPEYNKLVGGAKHSQHVLGNAVDISTKGWTGVDIARLVQSALNLDLAVGISSSFVHIDCRNTGKTTWTY